MESTYRSFGNSGLKVSSIGFGAGSIGSQDVDESQAQSLLHAAVELGINLIDTARSYCASEERIGRFLRAGGPRLRDRVVLSTKGGYGALGAEDWTADAIRLGVEQALLRLGVETIDIFHLHSCPLHVLQREDIVTALLDSQAQGKIRVAAYSGENEALGWAVESGLFGAIQCSVNLFDQHALGSAVAKAHQQGVGVIAKRALGNAPWRFSQEPKRSDQAVYWHRMKAMQLPFEPQSLSDLAIRYSAFAPGVSTALIGTTNLAHLQACVRNVKVGPLPQTQRKLIERAFQSKGLDWPGQI